MEEIEPLTKECERCETPLTDDIEFIYWVNDDYTVRMCEKCWEEVQ